MVSLPNCTATANEWQSFKPSRLKPLQEFLNARTSSNASAVLRSDDVWATRLQNYLASEHVWSFFAMVDGKTCGFF
ncbi:hypothetical protein H8K35_01460 [Undibacterium sp. LX40W]|uniref:Uncharacterized protein n=1 Tax=Undibacterium nitidum TaxID=2762298 RepID=A0A923KS72_9BURK|nr:MULTISPECIES: hypothetical protein [Undibacterium]MBC3880951.1 hypothetical protein [Undibacterium nitidum]MBC3890316.1 hypothetical protein [Undibacterium sp. LX40W]